MRPERTLRIIAGRWRARRFRFPSSDIRPTPDRVRETLFNWLQPRIEGAHCLDLFAGSGALGLEALSRGAASVLFIEQQRAAAAAIEHWLHTWQASGGVVVGTEAMHYLSATPPRGFDIVFLDPPYGSGALAAAAHGLERGWLARDARVYLEHARREPLPALSLSWRELRSGTAGEVGYHLFGCNHSGPVEPVPLGSAATE
ncbi:MAG: 16S rRNA (guanine(966)-N(2))-methyltransferase RsmD [Steroidobacterales bacterium]